VRSGKDRGFKVSRMLCCIRGFGDVVRFKAEERFGVGKHRR